jgi:uncharacterized protein
MHTRYLAVVGVLAVAITACTTPEVTVNPVVGQPIAGLPPGISVTGQGEVTGVPDTLTMTFGVSVLRPTVAEAVNVAADRADAVIGALQAQGVAESDIQTASYSIWPEYNYRDTGQELIGYRVENSVIAKVRDIENAGSVIDAASAAGGDEARVSGVSFAIEDDTELLQDARAAAWADATAKAEQLATLAGVTLGEPVSISETISRPPIVYPDVAFAGAEDAATPIIPGEQAVTVTLSVEFGIGG